MMMTVKRALMAAALVPALIACAADDEPMENVEVSRDAICSNGGGDTGDSCVNDGSGCPASCGMCFTSMQQKLMLLNKSSCEEGAGGSGGSGASACLVGSCSNGSESEAQACARAKAVQACAYGGHRCGPGVNYHTEWSWWTREYTSYAQSCRL